MHINPSENWKLHSVVHHSLKDFAETHNALKMLPVNKPPFFFFLQYHSESFLMRLNTREIPTPDSNSYHAQTLHTSAVVFVSKQSSSRHYRENIQSGD